MRFFSKATTLLLLGLALGWAGGAAGATLRWDTGSTYIIPDDGNSYFIDAAEGTVTLTDNLIIQGTLTVTGGATIDTNGNDIDVEDGGILRIEGEDGLAAGSDGSDAVVDVATSDSLTVESGGTLEIVGGNGGKGEDFGGTTPGGDGGNAKLQGSGTVTIETNSSLSLDGGNGGNGGQGNISGGPGGTGGDAEIGGTLTLTIETITQLFITGGNGGTGGVVTVDGIAGNGGNGGNAQITNSVAAGADTIGELRLTGGDGGDGGNAAATNIGNSATGGSGGYGGNATIDTSGLSNFQEVETLTLKGGNGGSGANATAAFQDTSATGGDGRTGGNADISAEINIVVTGGTTMNVTGGNGGDGGAASGDLGLNGSGSGGAGGSGGSAEFFAPSNTLSVVIEEDETINVKGGDGGDGAIPSTSNDTAGDGGDGGEAIFNPNETNFVGSTITMNVTGGDAGTQGASPSGSLGGYGGDASANSDETELDVEVVSEDVIVNVTVTNGSPDPNPPAMSRSNGGPYGGIATAFTTGSELRATDGSEFIPDNIFNCNDFILTLTETLYINFTWEIDCDKKIMGYGNKIVLGPDGEIVVNGAYEVEFCDLDIEGLHSTSPGNLRTEDSNANITMSDVVLKLDGDFDFERGNLKFDGHCFIDAPNFVFRLNNYSGSPTMEILVGATLEFLKNTTFEFDHDADGSFYMNPAGSGKPASRLILRDAMIRAQTNMILGNAGVLVCEGEATLFGQSGTIFIAGLDDLKINGGLTKLGAVDWTTIPA